jgi:hypothetical protein
MEELVPFQVQLERRQHRRLKRIAEREGRSMGAVVRESVQAYLASRDVDDDPAFELIGMIEDAGPTPHGDVGVAHDAYLAAALEAEVGPARARRARRKEST